MYRRTRGEKQKDSLVFLAGAKIHPRGHLRGWEPTRCRLHRFPHTMRAMRRFTLKNTSRGLKSPVPHGRSARAMSQKIRQFPTQVSRHRAQTVDDAKLNATRKTHRKPAHTPYAHRREKTSLGACPRHEEWTDPRAQHLKKSVSERLIF